MGQATLGEVLHYLRKATAVQGDRDWTDCELLDRFLTQREETAFALLVQRHGPMVQSVCRRVLGDWHNAEDAFQATFMVLARRASAIRSRESLASWLYGVAQRLACKARIQQSARRHREKKSEEMPRSEARDEHTWQELRTVLDEEIGRLPENTGHRSCSVTSRAKATHRPHGLWAGRNPLWQADWFGPGSCYGSAWPGAASLCRPARWSAP